ncbi:clavesin-1-like isoform X2 [Zophobas morio]
MKPSQNHVYLSLINVFSFDSKHSVTMLRTNYFKVDEDVKFKIYKEFNINPEHVQRDVQIIKDWVKQQPHLPEKIEDDFIQISLIRSKFKIETTKENIDKYYTLKGRKVDEILKIPSEIPDGKKQFFFITPLPQLTDNLERIIIFKVKNAALANENDILNFFKYCLFMNEFAIRCDYSLNVRLVEDLEGLTKDVFLKCAKTIGHIFKPYNEAYFARIAGIEFLNAPPFFELVVKSIKSPPMNMVLGEKLANRINIHRDYESLHKLVNKASLPQEYGGDLQSPLSEMDESFKAELRKYINSLDQFLINEVADESKRIGEVKYNDSFGPDGTFKNLCVD